MPVLTRAALEDSPLADLHALASELGIDGFRRLRKADLVDRIIAVQGGEPAADAAAEDEPADTAEPAEATEVAEAAEPAEPARRPRSRRGGRGRGRDSERARPDDDDTGNGNGDRDRDREERPVEGVVELLGNGSGFLRVNPPEPSDEDVYISGAQVRRCELVSGDRVAGPMRSPRRSERYPSLVRVETINDRPAEEVAEGTHFDDLPCSFPTERFAFGSDDTTLKAIEWLTPIGKGSRVVVAGSAHAGKSEALRRLAEALSGSDGLDVTVVLAGVRPEEVGSWSVEPAAALTFAASAEAQGQAIGSAIDTAKRIASRGGDAVVVIDSLEGVSAAGARKALAAARNITDGGSLTVIAGAAAPVGGETTMIVLDDTLTRTGRLPALDLVRSGTLHPELLVGDAGAEAIATARAAALGG